MITFNCDTSCDFRKTLVKHMDTVENTLLLYVPFATVGLWGVFLGIQNLLAEMRK